MGYDKCALYLASKREESVKHLTLPHIFPEALNLTHNLQGTVRGENKLHMVILTNLILCIYILYLILFFIIFNENRAVSAAQVQLL